MEQFAGESKIITAEFWRGMDGEFDFLARKTRQNLIRKLETECAC